MWGKPHQAIGQPGRNVWEQFAPFLAYHPEIRAALRSTNPIESLNARYRGLSPCAGTFRQIMPG